MTEPDPGSPTYRYAAAVLDAVAEGLTGLGVSVPGRRYVAPGILPAFDCAQLTVTVQGVNIGVPGQDEDAPLSNCGPVRYGRYRVDLVRDTPQVDDNGDPPSSDALDASARELLLDLDALDSVVRASRDVFAGGGDAAAGRGVPIYVGTTFPLGPDGGLAGSRVDLSIPLPSL